MGASVFSVVFILDACVHEGDTGMSTKVCSSTVTYEQLPAEQQQKQKHELHFSDHTFASTRLVWRPRPSSWHGARTRGDAYDGATAVAAQSTGYDPHTLSPSVPFAHPCPLFAPLSHVRIEFFFSTWFQSCPRLKERAVGAFSAKWPAGPSVPSLENFYHPPSRG